MNVSLLMHALTLRKAFFEGDHWMMSLESIVARLPMAKGPLVPLFEASGEVRTDQGGAAQFSLKEAALRASTLKAAAEKLLEKVKSTFLALEVGVRRREL